MNGVLDGFNETYFYGSENNEKSYVGHYIQGKRNGHGKLTTKNGDYFEGDFTNDNIKGMGKVYKNEENYIKIGYHNNDKDQGYHWFRFYEPIEYE